MIISNFEVTPNMAAPGETVHVEFTVAVEAGDTVNGLSVSGGPEQRVIYYDDSWRLDAGGSAVVSFDSVIPADNKYINSNLAASNTQQFTVPYWYVLLGEFGARADIPNPVTYVDKGLYPAVSMFTVERATGTQPNDEGENVLVSVKLSTGAFADMSSAYLRLYYMENGEPTSDSGYIDLTGSIGTLLEGVTDDSTLVTGTFSNSGNWVFKLVFGDADESAESVSVLPRAFANVHLSGDARGGVCFGGFSHGMGAFESYYPAFFYNGIEGVTNYSLDEVKTGGTWIDGKPIYRKIVSMEMPNANTWYFSEGDNAIEDVGSLVHIEYAYFLASGSILHGSTFYDTSLYLRLYCKIVDKLFQLCGWYAGSFAGTARAIVHYTKTENEEPGGDEGEGDLIEIIRPAAAMTSASSQNCVASASSENSSGYAAWKAFNKANSDQYGWASKQTDSSKWIQLKMDVVLTDIVVTIANRNSAASIVNGITAGTIQGSTDGSAWTDLCTISGRDGATAGASTMHECNNETPYSYVRIRITGSTNNSYAAVGEITIKGYAKEG